MRGRKIPPVTDGGRLIESAVRIRETNLFGLAKTLDISPSTLSKIKSGERALTPELERRLIELSS